METTDKQFQLISYRPDYWSHKEDERIGSELNFDDELTQEQLEERIFQLRRQQESDDDYLAKGWQFLIFHKGIPLASRGETFFRSERPTEELKALAAELNDIFHRADISSEEERAARKKREEEKRDAEHRAYQAQQEARRYQEAKDTIREYEAKQKVGSAR